MTDGLVGFAYLIASVCFILALRGLSSPETARQGNRIGIIGMVIAIVTTLMSPDVVSYGTILLGILIGGSIGTVVALRIKMTALPQLVAFFHSLVGLAAVFVATAALFRPDAYGIGSVGNIHTASLIEMSLGAVIGAITFSGSLIAFAKLQGIMSGTPLIFAGQHKLNAAIGIAIALATILFVGTESYSVYWVVVALAFAIGFLIIMPIGGADMPVVVSMLNSYSGWAAAGIGFTLSIRHLSLPAPWLAHQEQF